MKKENNMAAVSLEIFILVFILALIISSFGHSPRAVRLPLIMSGVTFALVSLDLIKALRNKRAEKISTIQRENAESHDKKLMLRLIGTPLLMLLTIGLWYTVGYLIGSIVAIVAIGLFLGIKKRFLLIAIAIAVSSLLFVIFGVLLGVPLPWGFIPPLF